MTKIIIVTGADRQRADEIVALFEGGNRVEVLGVLAEGAEIPAEAEWVVWDNAAESPLSEGVGSVRLAPGRTAPESAADILAAIRGAEAENDPDTAWARTLGVQRPAGQLPPPIPGAAPQPRPAEAPRVAEQPAGIQPGPANRPKPVMAAEEGTTEPMPPTYLVWSVVMTVLCCMPAGIVAIVFSSLVSSRYYTGNIEGSRRASRMAEIWIIVSFVLGVISGTLYLPMVIAGYL